MNASVLLQAYEKIKKENPNMRIRNIAQCLGVSEGELLHSRVGKDVISLQEDAKGILKEIIHLGEVMALTRNESCVHERKGIYKNGSFKRYNSKMNIGLFVNPDIDLRFFMDHWKYSFAVQERTNKNIRQSLQFFDKEGQAIHKIYLTENSHKEAYEQIVQKYKIQQEHSIKVESYETKRPLKSNSEIDKVGLRKTWENLKDTHDFFPMLQRFKVGREQALRLAGKDLAYQVYNNASREILKLARDSQCEIMVFVGNRGCLQIYTGKVSKLIEYKQWYNVLDGQFNLHLNEKNIAHTWVTKKPTVDGIVTALEVFDKNSELIVTFFGKRKPGTPELEKWKKIISQISSK